MDYKKIVNNPETRFKILKIFRFIPDTLMVKLQYRIKLGRSLNINEPRRFTEKLQWYKLYYRDPLMTQCADKYRVRQYIETKKLDRILTRLYAVYDKPTEVEIDSLPDKFVIKTNNGSGTNIICKDKAKISEEEVKKLLTDWLKRDYYFAGREWAYKNIMPKIIVEEYLEDEKNSFEGINDYKFICFNGEAKYIVLDVDRHVNHKRNFYDTKWNFIDVNSDHPNIGDQVKRPESLEEMLQIANIIAKDFPFVRVDLYWVNGRIFFGELTFYPWTGYVEFFPDGFDYTLGEKFELPVLPTQKISKEINCEDCFFR